jgi:hypothetical protein
VDQRLHDEKIRVRKRVTDALCVNFREAICHSHLARKCAYAPCSEDAMRTHHEESNVRSRKPRAARANDSEMFTASFLDALEGILREERRERLLARDDH